MNCPDHKNEELAHCPSCLAEYWKMQYHQARREGWEQAKAESEGIADTYFRASQINGHRSEIARKITKAIATMEYKEKVND